MVGNPYYLLIIYELEKENMINFNALRKTLKSSIALLSRNLGI